MWDLKWKILPKVYNTVYSQAVIWSHFLMQFQLLKRLVYTRKACCFNFFSANGDNIRPSLAKTIKSPELVNEKMADISRPYAPATVKTRRRVSRLRDVLFFLLTLFKLLASATKIARKSYFPLLYFVFFDSRAHINYIENFMVFSTLTASSHDGRRTRLRTFLRRRTWRVSQLN